MLYCNVEKKCGRALILFLRLELVGKPGTEKAVIGELWSRVTGEM